jgi:hypothetical protein
MSNSARWAIRIAAVVGAAVTYGVWRQIDREMGLGVASSFARGTLILGGLSWAWIATATRPKSSIPPTVEYRSGGAANAAPSAIAGSSSAPPSPRGKYVLAGVVAIAALAAAITAVATRGPKSYDDCILQNIKPGLSDVGA